MGKFLRLLGTLSLFRGDFLPLSKDSSHLCPPQLKFFSRLWIRQSRQRKHFLSPLLVLPEGLKACPIAIGQAVRKTFPDVGFEARADCPARLLHLPQFGPNNFIHIKAHHIHPLWGGRGGSVYFNFSLVFLLILNSLIFNKTS